MEFAYKHFCIKCGKLLLKSRKKDVGPLEIVCTNRGCKTKQIIGGGEKECKVINQNVYCAEREQIRQQFLLEKRAHKIA